MTKYRIVQTFDGEGLIASKTHRQGETYYFSTGCLEETTQRATCGVMGLTDTQAICAWPAFRSLACDLVKDGKLVHMREHRRALQDAIMLAADAGARAIVRQRTIKRAGLLGDTAPLLPLDAAPDKTVAEVWLETAEREAPGAMAAFDFGASKHLGERASQAVADHTGQVNLTDKAILAAVMKVQRQPGLSDEQRAATLEVLFSKASGNPLEQSPEALAAFALTDAMDKLTKGEA